MTISRLLDGTRPDGASVLQALRDRESRESVDGDLVGHEDRVARSSRAIAKAMGLSREDVEKVTLAARFHDIGKLGIPSSILRKPGGLTPEERAVVERHAEFGGDLLDGLDPVLSDAARYHHERWDGLGYHGMAGEDIPLVARIVAVADVHDALSAKRSYKPAIPEGEVLALMTRDAEGPQTGRDAFDPSVLRAFVRIRLEDPAASRDMDDGTRESLTEFVDTFDTGLLPGPG